MISSKNDLLYYLKCDALALGVKNSIRERFTNQIYKFQRLLRKCEYYNNCRKDPFSRIYLIWLKYRLRILRTRYGFSISLNTFGPGLSIAHIGDIVINNKVKVGSNCRIHVGVNIGAAAESNEKTPKLGDNIYIGPGAKLFGDIEIGDNTAIGANSVVNKSFQGNVTIGGIPAKIISHKSTEGLLVRATEVIDKKYSQT